LRTPFNPMSDATPGGDATSTGREGLQQVRLAKSLPNETGRFECLRVRAARPFVTITISARRLRITGAGGGVCRTLTDSICRNQLTRSSNAVGFPIAIRTCVVNSLRFGAVIRPSSSSQERGRGPAQGAGHVVAAFGRHSSRPKCGGRRDGCPGKRFPRGVRRRPPRLACGERNSLANSKRSGINSAQRASWF
jgi:hypothetical protein